ncbi:MAG TPA: cellulase family glycosylhydrolase, partial [Polyangiaceae bacterium]|nr:cellulase family glycosylhydrolase [Polyangiaceae bacterium]
MRSPLLGLGFWLLSACSSTGTPLPSEGSGGSGPAGSPGIGGSTSSGGSSSGGASAAQGGASSGGLSTTGGLSSATGGSGSGGSPGASGGSVSSGGSAGLSGGSGGSAGLGGASSSGGSTANTGGGVNGGTAGAAAGAGGSTQGSGGSAPGSAGSSGATMKGGVPDSVISQATKAADLVAAWKLGWNLGNSLDSNGCGAAGAETCWGNPMVTQGMLTYVTSLGFNVVRIPVTWSEHLGPSPSFTIDATWMARVDTVVNYAI